MPVYVTYHNARPKLDRLLFVSAAVMKISFTTTHYPRAPSCLPPLPRGFIWDRMEFNVHGSEQFLDYSEGILEGRVKFLSKNGWKIKRNYPRRKGVFYAYQARQTQACLPDKWAFKVFDLICVCLGVRWLIIS